MTSQPIDFTAEAYVYFERDDARHARLAAKFESIAQLSATQSHAAGRAEGLSEVAKVADASVASDREHMKPGISVEHRRDVLLCIATGKEIAAGIRALAAAEPAPGDQRNVTAEDVAMFDVALAKSVKVVAHPVEPGEVERLKAIETAARALRERVHSEETMRAWDRWRRAVETMPGASLPRDSFENWLLDLTSKLDVALSAPRPAPKGPKE